MATGIRAGILASCFIVSVGSLARAQSTPTDRQQAARAHYEAGKRLHERGEYTRAIEELLAAYQLAPVPELLFNLAQSYRMAGDFTHALEYYDRFLSTRPSGALAQVAKEQSDKLRREGTPQPTVNAAPKPGAVPPEPTPGQTVVPVAQPTDQPGRTLRTAGILTTGLGLGLLGTGIYFARSAGQASDELDAGYASGSMAWDAHARLVYDNWQRDRTRAQILIGVSAAAIIGGAIVYFWGRHSGASRSPSVEIGLTGAGPSVLVWCEL